jgi:hypothetical protein
MTVLNVVFVFSRISEEEEVTGDTSSASPSTLTHPATPTSISGELPRGISYQGPHGLHLRATLYITFLPKYCFKMEVVFIMSSFLRTS